MSNIFSKSRLPWHSLYNPMCMEMLNLQFICIMSRDSTRRTYRGCILSRGKAERKLSVLVLKLEIMALSMCICHTTLDQTFGVCILTIGNFLVLTLFTKQVGFPQRWHFVSPWCLRSRRKITLLLYSFCFPTATVSQFCQMCIKCFFLGKHSNCSEHSMCRTL